MINDGIYMNHPLNINHYNDHGVCHHGWSAPRLSSSSGSPERLRGVNGVIIYLLGRRDHQRVTGASAHAAHAAHAGTRVTDGEDL